MSYSEMVQYNKSKSLENISNGKLHIDTLDSALEMVTELLREAEEVAYDTAPAMRAELAANVATIREQVLQMANYQIDGKYVFSGDASNTQPYNSTT